MGIRARTAAVVTLTMIVLTAAMILVAREVIQTGFEELERDDTTKSVRLVVNWANDRAGPMGANATSYGAWTPTCRFVTDSDRGYVDSYLNPDDFKNLQIEFMAFLDEDGRLVFAKYIDLETHRVRPLPQGLREFLVRYPEVLNFTRPLDPPKSGLAGLPEGPLIVGAAPIVTSESDGPIRGTVVVGRYLGADDQSDLTRATELDATWYSASSPKLPAEVGQALDDIGRRRGELVVRDDGTVLGYGAIDGVDGVSVVAVEVTQPRSIYDRGNRVVGYIVLGLAVFIVASVAALLVALNTSVLSRLAQLSRRVRQIGQSEDPKARVEIGGGDEIAQLATSINGMLEALEESRHELVMLATHDPLTGVFNRRRFEEELTRQLAEQERLGRGGALLWFDLDDFKDINDQQGHAAGDDVLVQFAETLRSETRRYSTLARIGGDEFVMVIPGAGEAEALRAAERLLQILDTREFLVAGGPLRVRASIGVALFPRDGATVDELLAHADAAMYAAKRRGGERVSVYREAAPR